jgi:hypothetical protein
MRVEILGRQQPLVLPVPSYPWHNFHRDAGVP